MSRCLIGSPHNQRRLKAVIANMLKLSRSIGASGAKLRDLEPLNLSSHIFAALPASLEKSSYVFGSLQ